MAIIQSINLDIFHPETFAKIRLQQGDMEDIKIAVAITQNRESYSIPTNAIVYVKMLKPDGTYIINECELIDNIVYFTVTAQMTAVATTNRRSAGKIIITNPTTGGTIMTVNFHFMIDEEVIPDSVIASTDEFTLLQNMILRVTDADILVSEAEQIIDTAHEVIDATNQAINNTNQATLKAKEATVNATNASIHAIEKASLADNSANNANEKATLANNAANYANDKATLADSAANNANDKAMLVEEVIKNATTATNNTTEAINNAVIATQNSNKATENANAAVSNINNKINETDLKIQTANTAINNADTATERANQAAKDAEDIVAGTGMVMQTEKGAPNGVASLDANGKVPHSQLPHIASEAQDIAYDDTTTQIGATDIQLALEKLKENIDDVGENALPDTVALFGEGGELGEANPINADRLDGRLPSEFTYLPEGEDGTRQLKDSEGNNINPITKIDAVFDDNGVGLDEKLSNIFNPTTQVTDANDAPNGICKISGGELNNPFSFWATLVTYEGLTSLYKQQNAYGWSAGEKRIAYRHMDYGTWSDWLYINDVISSDTINDPNKIPSSAVTYALGQEVDDLELNKAWRRTVHNINADTLAGSGFYIANNTTGTPHNSWFGLSFVDDGHFGVMNATDHAGNPFFRTKGSSTWGEWKGNYVNYLESEFPSGVTIINWANQYATPVSIMILYNFPSDMPTEIATTPCLLEVITGIGKRKLVRLTTIFSSTHNIYQRTIDYDYNWFIGAGWSKITSTTVS